ncbi:MAG: hypothetical protein RLZZ203_1825, partial [Cyanobacteriota bacterium]
MRGEVYQKGQIIFVELALFDVFHKTQHIPILLYRIGYTNSDIIYDYLITITEIVNMTPSSLEEIAQYLEQHEQSKRIKKLIFCVAKNIWENDQSQLDRFKLQ